MTIAITTTHRYTYILYSTYMHIHFLIRRPIDLQKCVHRANNYRDSEPLLLVAADPISSMGKDSHSSITGYKGHKLLTGTLCDYSCLQATGQCSERATPLPPTALMALEILTFSIISSLPGPRCQN